jgi:hypothetical protein
MHPANYSKPREANESGKFEPMPVVGLHRIDNHGYKKHKYEINSRQVGLTVKRTTFSATITNEFGERLTFLTDMPTSVAAQKAAEAWIDGELRRRPKLQRRLRPQHSPPILKEEPQVE